MATMSTYLANKILDHTLRNTSYTPAATVYAALMTTAPTDAASGTEVTGGSYARQSITFGAAASRAVTSTNLVNFGTASADWGTITHMAIFDAVSGGNMLYYDAVDDARTVLSGDSGTFPIGTLSVSVL